MEKYSMEVQDQMNYFALQICNQMLHCVLLFEEHLDEGILKKAIWHSLRIEEILGCRLVKQGSQVYWETREDSEHWVQCEVVETANVQKGLEDFLVKEIDVENDPLVQFKIFRNEKDCLCVKISHVICDAGGLKNYVSLLAGLYTELMNGNEMPIKYRSTRDRSQNQILRRVEPSVIDMLGEKVRNFFNSTRPNWSFPSKGYKRSQLRFVMSRTSGKLYHETVNIMKKKSATMNDMLLTAFCLALRKEEGYPSNQPMLVQVPVDLRRYLADKDTLPVCNLSGAEYLNIMTANEDFAGVLDIVQKAMQSIKANYPGLTSALALEYLARAGYEQAMSITHGSMEKSIQNNVSIPILTNMGVIPDACKKFGNVVANDGYLVSPLMYSPGFMLGVSSFGDTITFTAGFSEASIKTEQIRKFLARIIAELEQACQLTTNS